MVDKGRFSRFVCHQRRAKMQTSSLFDSQVRWNFVEKGLIAVHVGGESASQCFACCKREERLCHDNSFIHYVNPLAA